MRRTLLGLLIAGVVAAGARVAAEDWPEWRGTGRLGVWTETGLLEKFPDGGLRVAWRTPIHGGYAGPAVAGGRVFVTDARRVSGSRMIERAIALDEGDGRVLWAREWEANYSGLETIFAVGPRATPTVDGNRVYVVGTMGNLLALDVRDGRVLWQKNFVKDFDASVPSWGMTSAPIVDGDRLIAVVGGEPNAKVMAFNKLTGDEVWRALSSDWEPGYNQPIIIEAARTRQLIIWHPRAISSLNPATGTVYWEVPFEVDLGMTVPTPVQSGAYLLVSSIYNSARMLKLDGAVPGAALAWRGDNEAISALIATPVIDGKYIYGVSGGELDCWEVETGKRIWRSRELIKERTAFSTAFIVRNGDRYFINTERGDLVIARLSPAGYEEISRATLIEPTHPNARRQDLGPVHWSHPAYANRHIFVRNDKEILKASLAKE
jgi:outer membrane protein assembly factor BamB